MNIDINGALFTLSLSVERVPVVSMFMEGLPLHEL